LSRLVLAYDADCGPCTRFKRLVEFIDARNRVDFISLIEADESGLLDEIPRSARHASFHLILPSGKLLNGPAAIPSLIKLLPLGRATSKIITSAPGGPRLISFVYAGFSRLHDRGSCRYLRSSARPSVGFAERISKDVSIAGPSRSEYVFAGLIGGFFGSLAMGGIVPLPDALCLTLATDIAGRSPVTYALAWAFHVVTGVAIGAAFGILASVVRVGSRRPMRRSIFLGLLTGMLVWAGFFTPSIVTFMPSLVTYSFVELSLAAHVVFGLVLGATLSVRLSWGWGQAKKPW